MLKVWQLLDAMRQIKRALGIGSPRADELLRHILQTVGRVRLEQIADRLLEIWRRGNNHRPDQNREVLVQLAWLFTREFRSEGPPSGPPPGGFLWKKVLAETPELSPGDRYSPMDRVQVPPGKEVFHVFHPNMEASIYDMRQRSVRIILQNPNLSDIEQTIV